VLAADHVPIAPLPIPVAVLVGVPVGVIPTDIGVDSRAIARMYCSAVVRMDSSPVGPAGMISAIGATNSGAAFAVHRRAITGLNCRAMLVMGGFAVFPLIRIRAKSGG